jgi:two-component system OmpR family response regulator
MRILLVEDEAELADAVVEALTCDLHAVDHASDGPSARALADDRDYDLVILDWNIPAPNGEELLRSWRASGRAMPVLILTGSRTTVRDKVAGLDFGADDYLTKPFAFAELRARVRSLLRRRERRDLTCYAAGDLEMERASRTVRVAGETIHLSPKEFAVLEYLLMRCDAVVQRHELIDHVWDGESEPASNVVDVLIHRMRKKIDGEKPKRLLHTIPGVGYMLRSERS